MEDGCATLRKRRKRRDCSEWIMLEGRGKTLLLGAHQVVGNKAVGNHTGKTIHFSIFEL